LLLVDLRNKDITGLAAETALEKSNITVNKNTVPFEDKSPRVTSGIRIGTPAVTTRNMKENEMVTIAELISEVLNNIDNERVHANIREKVEALCKAFPMYRGVLF